MFIRLLQIIASIFLLVVFVLSFHYAVLEFQKADVLKDARTTMQSRSREFVKSLTPQEISFLSSMSCLTTNECDENYPISRKLINSFKFGSIKSAFLTTTDGRHLLNPLNYENISQLEKDSEGKEEVLIRIIQEKQGKNDILKFQNFYNLGILSNNQKLSKILIRAEIEKQFETKEGIKYSILVSAIFLIPLGLLILSIVLQTRRIEKMNSMFVEENENFQKQVESLKKENVQQSQFLANFTHELRTPLNSIIGFSGLIKDQTLGPLGHSEYANYAKDINTSGSHLLSLINDILDYSKAEVGRLKVNVTEVDLVKLVKQCLAIIAPRASESGVDLLQNITGDFHIVKIDAKRLKQVLLNLLSNSVKFTPENGSVTVAIYPDIRGEKIFLEIKDTGVGIAEKDIPIVMSLFGQVETNLSRKYEGTGIGLPFAKKLTTLMGGTFEITSKLGLGTRITLAFPYDKKLNAQAINMYEEV